MIEFAYIKEIVIVAISAVIGRISMKVNQNTKHEIAQDRRLSKLEQDVAVMKHEYSNVSSELKELKVNLKDDFKEIKGNYKNIESLIMKILARGD
jgi:Na+-translocating ferredoxin:NAD+ oxidoreductase RnfG subunit